MNPLILTKKYIYISIETIQYLWYNKTRKKKEKKSRMKEEYLKTLINIKKLLISDKEGYAYR